MEKSKENWKRLVFLLALGWVVIWFSRTIITPIYPTLSEYFGNVSDSQLGNISSLYFLGYVINQIPSGMLVDKIGYKKVALGGFTTFLVGTILAILRPSFLFLLIGSFLSGIGSGTFFSVAYSLSKTKVPAEKRNIGTAIINSGSAIGSSLGLVTASYFVTKKGINWQTLYLYLALFTLVVLYLFYRFFEKHKKKEDCGPVKRHIFQRQKVAAYVMYFCTIYGYFLIQTWLPDFLNVEREFPHMVASLITSGFFLMAIPSSVFFSFLSGKFPELKVKIIVCLELVSAIMLLLICTTKSPYLLIAAVLIYGMSGKLAIEPIVVSWLGDFIQDENVAEVFGIFNFFGMMGSVIAPKLTGVISDVTGSTMDGFIVAALLLVVGSICFLVLNRHTEESVLMINNK